MDGCSRAVSSLNHGILVFEHRPDTATRKLPQSLPVARLGYSNLDVEFAFNSPSYYVLRRNMMADARTEYGG